MATDPTSNFQDAPTQQGGSSADQLTQKAERCRRLASGISDKQAADVLRSMATQYEDSAKRLKD